MTLKILYKKIREVDKKLSNNDEEMWKVKEKRRKLELELMELREKMFNINKERVK